MKKRTYGMLPATLVLLCIAAAASGCAPLRAGTTENAYYQAGIVDSYIRVTPPLTLAGSGDAWPSVPSDTNIAPFGTFHFGVYTDDASGPVDRFAYIVVSQLPPNAWRWEMETWGTPQTLLHTKSEGAGKFWTIQMMPVVGEKDWFNSLWAANKRQTPDFWLAKRWSATPDDQDRIVAEYREAAPQCVRNLLADALQNNKSENPLPRQDEIWRDCRDDINAFSNRADKVFDLQRMPAQLTEAPLSKPMRMPREQPNMVKLVGKAERIDTGNDSSFSN